MKHHWIAPLFLSLAVACTPEPGNPGGGPPSADGGAGGGNSKGGSGGNSKGGSGGSAKGGSGGSAKGGSGGGDYPGTGGGGGAGGTTEVDASAPSVDAEAPAADMGGGNNSGSPAAALDKFVFDVPCPAGTVKAAGNCSVSSAEARKKTKTIMFGGNPATTYKVKLHVCAPMEGRGYTGCQAGPESKVVCMDGMPMGGQYQVTYPTYSMAVSAPMHKYYLNNQYKADDIAKIEYSSTFDIQGGAMLTFETDGGSNADVYTADFKKHNHQCPGAPGIMQPFPGQFLYFTVESITPMN